jgi:hypothetical protein
MTLAIKRQLPLLLALALLTGCKSAAQNDRPAPTAGAEKTTPTPTEVKDRKTSYFHVSDEGTLFLQWTEAEKDQQIKGHMLAVGSNRYGKIDRRWFRFDGVLDRDDLRLTFLDPQPTFLEGRTVAGAIKGNSLTLFWPQRGGMLRTWEFRPMSLEMMEQMVATTEVEKVEAEKRASAHKELSFAIKELPGDDFYADALSSYGDAWREMKIAYEDMLNEIRKQPNGDQLGTVRPKLETVKRLLDPINDRRSAFEDRVSSANAKIRNAEEALTRFHSAFPLGPQDVAANTAGEPRDLTTAAAMVIEAARFKINGAVGARDAAKNQAAAYDRQAVELHQQVEALVKTRNR